MTAQTRLSQRDLVGPDGKAPPPVGRETVAMLLAHKADVNSRNALGETPLFRAVGNNCVENVRLLIAAGADLGARDLFGRSVIFQARRNDTIELLLARGVNINDRDTEKGLTPLHLTAWNGDTSAAEALLAHGADPNLKSNDGRTPLDFALEDQNKWPTVALLVGATGQIDFHARGMNALQLAAWTGVRSAVVNLIAKGADLNATNEQGSTALHYAAWVGQTDIVSLLIAKGANVNARDQAGRTPLFSIFNEPLPGVDGKQLLETARVLLANGAEVNARDNKGLTALKYGQQSRRPMKMVSDLLREKGGIE